MLDDKSHFLVFNRSLVRFYSESVFRESFYDTTCRVFELDYLKILWRDPY
jgi:hypothetical protein